jgi:restriction system protein
MIPDYQGFMLPLLRTVADGEDHALRDLTRKVADDVGLSDTERQELLPSGQQTVLSNRVAWAKTYLKKAGSIVQPARGRVRITSEGKAALAKNPARIDNDFLSQYPGFVAFFGKVPAASDAASRSEETVETPEEALETSYQALRASLADELLERLKTCSPRFFERLVVQLLVAMGYSGSLADASQAVGRSGDGGIDGIIKEDRLGLDVVCVQAKRWQGTVGSQTVREFAGSMEGMRARKGVLITTSVFSRDAEDYVSRIERKIVLIDGERLAELMIDYNIGVTESRSFTIKRVDLDYFLDEDA